MRFARLLVLPALTATVLYGAYQYYLFDPLTSINTSNWQQNGTVTATASGLTATTANGGSLISKLAVPDGTSDYEVLSDLNLTASGGTYVQYVRASQDALSGPAAQGSYWAVELQNPSSPNPGQCTATLAVYKREAGVVTLMGTSSVTCKKPSSQLRSVAYNNAVLAVYLNGTLVFWNGQLTGSGNPGIGARGTPTGNSITQVKLGPQDRVGPSGVNPQSISTNAFPNRVDAQWQGVLDDPNGIGWFQYRIERNGAWFSEFYSPEFSDTTVAPSTTYTYNIYSIDYHFQFSPVATFTITTPAVGSLNPARTGVRSTGSYWGAGSEQIDMLSGNLNFTLPLVKANGRGFGATFAASYNSQLWRKDSNATWKLGRDVGYGFGWRLMAGSITPYWSSAYVVNHYLFVDSTGAEYRLDVNTSNVWTSKEAIYLSYNASQQKLYFPDGSFWFMGAISGGTEQDGGSRYPTLMQDSNGNQIKIRYGGGVGVEFWPDSSARITEIEDVRAIQVGGVYKSYTFSYNTDAIPHLTGIQNYIGTAETYTFYRQSAQSLYSPFSPSIWFGWADLLGSVWNSRGEAHIFDYSGGAGGEMTKVTFHPYGGEIRWTHRTFTFANNKSIREVQWRYLRKAAGAPEVSYQLWRDDATDAGRDFHLATSLIDPNGQEKGYIFGGSTGGWSAGLITIFLQRLGSVQPFRQDFTWTQDAAGNPYIASTLTTLDENTGFQKQSKAGADGGPVGERDPVEAV